MKKLIAISMITIIFCTLLSGCGGRDITYSGKYDDSNYSQVGDISGVSFLVPKTIFDKKEPASNKANYSAEEAASHVFHISDAENYNIYTPGNFFLYVFDLGKVSGITEISEIEKVPEYIGTTDWLTFEATNPHFRESNSKNGDTQTIFHAYINEKLTGTAIKYLGYVSLLYDKDSGKSYCLVVGYGNSNSDSIAKNIAENFLLAK